MGGWLFRPKASPTRLTGGGASSPVKTTAAHNLGADLDYITRDNRAVGIGLHRCRRVANMLPRLERITADSAGGLRTIDPSELLGALRLTARSLTPSITWKTRYREFDSFLAHQLRVSSVGFAQERLLHRPPLRELGPVGDSFLAHHHLP